VLNVHNGFVARGPRALAAAPVPKLPPEAACRSAAVHLGVIGSRPIVERRIGGPEQKVMLRSPRISRDAIPARLMHLPEPSGGTRLVWNLSLRAPNHRHWWDLNVDAETGEVLSSVDWGRDAAYQVYPLPLVSPDEGPRSLQVDPANAMASPFGWHDTDGRFGADFTDTRGNNAEAQEDADANDTSGFRPSGGSGLHFDFPADLGREPLAYRSAAIVNAFYLTNLLHDIHYHYGFDESSGNFQRNNYGSGGSSGDPVIVDVQDGAQRNNANFLAPPDGSPGRMQLFLWTDGTADLQVSVPAAISGSYAAGDAEFGPLLTDQGTTGSVVLALDAENAAGPSPTDACSRLTNAGAIRGNLALIDRGTCFFVVKIDNARRAGAIGAIIVNNQGDDVFTMARGGAGDPLPSIPSLIIGQGDGDILKSQLAGGVLATLRREPTSMRDSALANDTVVHEYGHGVTMRLTGGRSNSSCLDRAQSAGMGEGWSDWHALALLAEAGDEGDRAVPRAAYLFFQPPTGGGIRNFPYSTDLGTNPLTYASIATLNQPHGVGEVWASALWEMYWNLVEAHGFTPDLYAEDGGNTLALQLVMDGLKLQGCDPTFLDGRDAILMADLVLGGENACAIWRAFAKRGMGIGADDGGDASILDVTESFDVPVQCLPTPPRLVQQLAALGALAGLGARCRSGRRSAR
jgi:hypothetical protein